MRTDVRQQVGDPWEQPAFACGAFRVVGDELQAGGLIGFIAGHQAQRYAQQAARALGGHRAQLFVGQGLHAAARALAVGRRGQVGGGIGQGAVEVEQDQRAHLRVAIR